MPLEATFSPCLSFTSASLLFRSSPLCAHFGNPLGSYRSNGRVVSYCADPVKSTKASSLSVKDGFRSAVEDSSFVLKWVPFRFRSRNCWNFLLVAGGGEPGGEGGIVRFGIEGRVRSWTMARMEE